MPARIQLASAVPTEPVANSASAPPSDETQTWLIDPSADEKLIFVTPGAADVFGTGLGAAVIVKPGLLAGCSAAVAESGGFCSSAFSHAAAERRAAAQSATSRSRARVN